MREKKRGGHKKLPKEEVKGTSFGFGNIKYLVSSEDLLSHGGRAELLQKRFNKDEI